MLKNLLGGISAKYLWIAVGALIAGNLVLGYLYKEALQDQDRIRLTAQVEAQAAANERAAKAAANAKAAADERERVLQERAERAAEIARNSAERAENAESKLRNFVTETQTDKSPGYEDWKDTQLPGSVVDRLQGLKDQVSK